MKMKARAQAVDLDAKTKLYLILIALVGALTGAFFGYKIEDYRFSLAFDKVHLKEAEVFMEWYVKICEDEARLATQRDTEHSARGKNGIEHVSRQTDKRSGKGDVSRQTDK